MKKPLWILLDDGEAFEGHQGQWANCFFSNATESAIRYVLEDSSFNLCYGIERPETSVIREMTDAEMERYPEALVFQQFLIKEYGEC